MYPCGAISGQDGMDGSPYGSINITRLLAFMETSVINIKHTFMFLTIPR